MGMAQQAARALTHRKPRPLWHLGIAAVVVTAALPLAAAIAILSVRYATGQFVEIRSIERACILYERVGRERVLERRYIDCADYELERGKLSGAFAGWDYGHRVNIVVPVKGIETLLQLDMSEAELTDANRGNRLWIGRVDHPRQKIVVMADWTYVLSPIIVPVGFLVENPGIWAAAVLPAVVGLLMQLGLTLYRHVRLWIAGGPV